MQCDNVVETRLIVVIDKKEKSCIIMDIAVPADGRVSRQKGKRKSWEIPRLGEGDR